MSKNHRCVSCAKIHRTAPIFGVCVPCQDFIIDKRSDDLALSYRQKCQEDAFKFADQEREIKKLRSELKVEQAAVDLVKLIRKIK